MNIKDIFIIILNSIFTSLVIGYFVFNISYIEKSCNPLQEYCEIRGDYLSKDFISNQIEIFNSYLLWLQKAVYLDFGSDASGPLFNQIIEYFFLTFKLIMGSIIIALSLSILIYRISFFDKINKHLIIPLMSISYLHLALFIFLFSSYTQSSIYYNDGGIWDDFIVCLILVISNGMIYDFYTLLKEEHDVIINKDYSIFAKHSGYNQYIFIFRELIISFIYITISRIPILFASMTILEVLSGGKYEGIGRAIWGYIQKNELNMSGFFASTFSIILFFTLLYFTAEYLRSSLSPKSKKT